MADKSACTTCKVWSWIIQILVLVFLVLMIVFMKDSPWLIFAFIFCYLAYFVTNAASDACCYLLHKHDTTSIHDLLKTLFKNSPIMSFHCECYHYVTRTHMRNGRRTTSRHKVTTHRGSEAFNYYSWRDISGVFLLDSNKVIQSEKKSFIRLKLSYLFDFADDISARDYSTQRLNFKSRNSRRDTHFRFWETKTLGNFNEFNLVRITDSNPCFVSKYWFFFFTFIIPIVEFYKLYLDKTCISQEFKIKKSISTRYNLNESNSNQNVPGVAIFNQAPVVFEDAPAPMHSNPIAPSLEELQEAEGFRQRGDVMREVVEDVEVGNNEQNNTNQNQPLSNLQEIQVKPGNKEKDLNENHKDSNQINSEV